MNNKALLVVNSLLFVSMAAQFVSGFLLRSGPVFRYIHLNNPPILLILVMGHLYLNRGWIKQRMIAMRKR